MRIHCASQSIPAADNMVCEPVNKEIQASNQTSVFYIRAWWTPKELVVLIVQKSAFR